MHGICSLSFHHKAAVATDMEHWFYLPNGIHYTPGGTIGGAVEKDYNTMGFTFHRYNCAIAPYSGYSSSWLFFCLTKPVPIRSAGVLLTTEILYIFVWTTAIWERIDPYDSVVPTVVWLLIRPSVPYGIDRWRYWVDTYCVTVSLAETLTMSHLHRSEHQLYFYGHLALFPAKNLTCRMLSCRDGSGWTRPRGRPHVSWLRQMKA